MSNYPSAFGSHASMIDVEETAKLENSDFVVLKDEEGTYTTEKKRLDNGLADPNRYRTSRLIKLLSRNKGDDK